MILWDVIFLSFGYSVDIDIHKLGKILYTRLLGLAQHKSLLCGQKYKQPDEYNAPILIVVTCTRGLML